MAEPIDSAQRDLLIETGARIFHERGYTATGVRQIAAAAAVPSGSFTNHFRSKERFGAEVLKRYVARLDRIMDDTLRDGSRPSAARIEAYFDTIEDALAERDWGVGCLIPDLATETPMHSELLRDALAHVMERHTRAFVEALDGLADPAEAADAAGVLLAAWHGTLLRMKVERSSAPIGRFRRTLRRLLQADR